MKKIQTHSVYRSIKRSLFAARSLKSIMLAIAISSTSIACSAPTSVSSASSPQSAEPQNTQLVKDQASSDSRSVSKSMGGMNHGMDHSAMSLGPADADFDLRFLDGMVPHHEGAVVMAQEVLAKSQRPELKKLANEVIAAQKKEITQMQQWRKEWYPNAGAQLMAWHGEMNHMMAMSDAQMSSMRMDMDLGAADADFDLRFINAMIPHHEGALVMAQDAIAKSRRSQITKLSQEIIASQQAEIEQMKQWRKAWYNQ